VTGVKRKNNMWRPTHPALVTKKK